MPELPDLHVFCQNLKKQVLDKPIVCVTLSNRGKFNATPAAFTSALKGSSIADVARVGKELHFQLSSKKVFAVHLMLSGQFHLLSAEAAEGIPYRVFSVAFQDGGALSVSDPRNMCRVTLNPRKSDVPDVLAAEFDPAYFARAARNNPWSNVKAFLIDQNIMKGIGNAYADEILWKADISPESIVEKIPPEALSDLYSAIGDVLKDAIDSILRISPDIVSGEERSFLKVHHPKKTATEEGEPILVKEIATKRTYYTQKQRLFR